MVEQLLKFDDIVVIPNPTQAQRDEFDKVNTIRDQIRRDPAVQSALAAFVADERKFKAEHAEPILPGGALDLPESARKEIDNLFGVLADSFKKHGVGDAPATLEAYLKPKPSQQIVRAAELSIITASMKAEDATQPTQAPDTPIAKPPSALKRLGG